MLKSFMLKMKSGCVTWYAESIIGLMETVLLNIFKEDIYMHTYVIELPCILAGYIATDATFSWLTTS